MELINKIKADAKDAWASITDRYHAIQSPIARMAVVAIAGIAGVYLFFQFLPWLILLAVIGGIGFVVYAATQGDA